LRKGADETGLLLFEMVQSNLPGAGWNGEFKGKATATGVYAVVIEALLADDCIELLEGKVVLVR
jgi:hypothetical protein